MHVSLRERTGDLGAGMSLHYGDLDLAQVPKKEKVIVLAGKYKDCKGYVTVRPSAFKMVDPIYVC